MFGSPRQALGYMYAASRGPGLAQCRWDTVARGTGRTPWDHVEVAAMLYGPKEAGCCGIERDSPLDRELRAWATTPGHPRSAEVRAVEVRLRRRMRAHGIKKDHARTICRRLTFADVEGVEHTHAVELEVLPLGV